MADAYAIVLGFIILFYIIADPLQSETTTYHKMWKLAPITG